MKTADQFKEIQAEGLEIFKRKNKDYADSFREEGVLGVMIRMKDKLSRFINLARHEGEGALCKEEKLRDTLIDLHNYAALAIICHEAGDGWGEYTVETGKNFCQVCGSRLSIAPCEHNEVTV